MWRWGSCDLRGRGGSWVLGSGSRRAQQSLVLLLLEAQPVLSAHMLGSRRLGGEPALDRLAQERLAFEPEREADLAEVQPVRVEQLAQGGETLQLRRAIQAVAGAGAIGLDEPDALDIAQHPRRPAGRGGRLVDRQRIDACDRHLPDLITSVSRF